MLKLSNAIPVLLSSVLALGVAASVANAAEGTPVHVIKPAHAALFEVGTKKVAATYVANDNVCDVVVSVANLPDADGYAKGAPTRTSTPIAAGSQARVYVTDGYILEASCALSAKLLTVRTLALTASAQ